MSFELTEKDFTEISEIIDDTIGIAYGGIYGQNERANLFSIISQMQKLRKKIREAQIKP